MESEGSLSHSQEAANCPYLEPHQSSSRIPSLYIKLHFNIIGPSTSRFSKWSHMSGFPTKTLHASPL